MLMKVEISATTTSSHHNFVSTKTKICDAKRAHGYGDAHKSSSSLRPTTDKKKYTNIDGLKSDCPELIDQKMTYDPCKDDVILTKLPLSKRKTEGPIPLPLDFVPCPHTVLIGRGKSCANAIGNRRLLILALNFVTKYSKATSRQEKTEVVSTLVEMVQAAGHGFVKYTNGQWWQVEEMVAREKVGSVLRDCLSSQYKSSTQSKVIKRRERKRARKASNAQKQKIEAVSDDGSATTATGGDRSATGSETSEAGEQESSMSTETTESAEQHLLVVEGTTETREREDVEGEAPVANNVLAIANILLSLPSS